ncbi:MAG: hypothetical protein ACRC0Y_11095 [Fusobacteriaceae bacterium]
MIECTTEHIHNILCLSNLGAVTFLTIFFTCLIYAIKQYKNKKI